MLESLFNRFFPVNIAKLLITAFFKEHLRWLFLSVWYSNCSVFSICWPSLIKQKHNLGWVLLKRFVCLSRVCSLQIYIITRNHLNTFLLINMQKTNCFCPLLNVYFDYMQINRWLTLIKLVPGEFALSATYSEKE